MDLSITWNPRLVPFRELQKLANEAKKPGPASSPSWSKAVVRNALGGRSDGLEVLWMSVLNIWRLRELEGDLEEADDADNKPEDKKKAKDNKAKRDREKNTIIARNLPPDIDEQGVRRFFRDVSS